MLVPVAISATHVRYNAVRMEPTWMILGHAAGTTAALSIKSNVAIHDVNVKTLQQSLMQQNQLLWSNQSLYF